MLYVSPDQLCPQFLAQENAQYINGDCMNSVSLCYL